MRRTVFGLSLLILTAAAPVLFPAQAGAQLQVPGADTAFSITFSPAQPGPGETVSLSLSSPLYDLDQSTITWKANGKTITSGVGEKTASIIAGKLGEQTLVTADITTDSVSGTAQTLVTPTAIDLLWESDSYVPPFYTGRALPSAGSSVRVQAIPYIPKKDGGFYSASELTYTWKENGAMLSNLSGRGKASAVLASPDLFGNYTISVDVVSPDGTVSGAASATIASVEPVVRLYRDHPLFGMEYFDALSATTFIDETEMTFAAVPYFADAHTANDAHLVYAWHINGKSVPADSAQPSEVTINAGDTGGLARIELSLTDAANVFVDAVGAWAVTFTNGGGGAAGGGAAGDLFHGNQ